MQAELVHLSQQYEKTGAALVSVEIALDDALSREADAAAGNVQRQEQSEALVSQLTARVAQLEAALAQRTAEAGNNLSDCEELASRYVQAQEHLLQVQTALHPPLGEDLGGVGLSLMTVEAGHHALLASPPYVRIENIVPHSSAAAAAKAGLLKEGALVHKIDMLPVEVRETHVLLRAWERPLVRASGAAAVACRPCVRARVLFSPCAHESGERECSCS